MALVDLNNEKIYGCEPGSKTYLHEKGHIVFNKMDKGVRINYYGYFFQMIAVFFISLGVVTNSFFVKLFGFLNAFGMIVCYLWEELWCWSFAFTKEK